MKMAYSASCVLCLTNEALTYLNAFDDANGSLNIAQIISKHLWFELKPLSQSFVCGDCWNILHNFHLFYNKLERIHNEELYTTDTVEQAEKDLHGSPEKEQLQNTVDVEHEIKFVPNIEVVDTFSTNPLEEEVEQCQNNVDFEHEIKYVPNIEVVDTFSTNPLQEEMENKHCFGMEDYATNDEERDDYSPSDDNMLEEDILNTNSKSESVRKEPPKGNATRSAEKPIKRGRGRPPKTKPEQPSVTYNEKQTLKDLTSPETSAKRPTSRPPKRKLDDSNISLNDMKIISRQATVPTSFPPTNEPIKRGRGRPPKKSLVMVHSDQNIKKDTDKYNESTVERRTKAKRKSLHGRKSNYESESGSDNDSDFEMSEKKQTSSAKREKSDRDERIFKFIEDFCCHYCVEKVSFKRFVDADRHYKLVHNEPSFLKCPKCERKCFTSGMFVSHMETHDDPEKYKCNICGKMADCDVTFKKHMRVHLSQLEANLPFPCSRCKRKFESDEQRIKHEKLHVPKPLIHREKGPDLELLAFYKRIYCHVCEEQNPESTSFDNFWDLKVHMQQEHNKTASLKCPICNKKILHRPQLVTHIDMHNNPENYRCEVCKEVYQNLDLHMIKAHTPTTAIPEEKKHKCDQCGRMFNFVAHLKKHIDFVHGSKEIHCTVCNKYFSLTAFQVHKRKVHTDEMLMCEHCPEMFKSHSALKLHKGIHDGTQVQFTTCKLCNKKIRPDKVKRHMATQHYDGEPVSCELCGKSFRTMFHMNYHQKYTCEATIDSRKHKCEVCGKGFSQKLAMIEHMTTHTRTKNYQCAFCFKSFGYISNLHRHRKKAHPLEWQEIQARPEENIASVIVVRN